ncbi:MAG: hypothetical protein ACK5A0_04430 [Polaromonas sp.]
MQVSTAQASQRMMTYIVPPSRAVWIQTGARHHITVLEAAEFRTLYIHKSRTPKGWTGCRVIVVSPVLREAVHALDTSPTIYRHMKRRVLPWGGPAAKP